MARGGPRPKHIPIRTCVACRRTSAKRGLVRLVRDGDGRVDVDPTGKRNGRGAYLHEQQSCWDAALRRDILDAALKVTLSPDDQARLRSIGEAYPAEAADPTISS